MKDVETLEMELRALLIEAEEVRQSLKGFLAFLGEEFARFPAQRSESHWNLVMNDGDRSAQSTFVLFVVTPTQVRFAAGQGSPNEIRDLSEHYDGSAEESLDQFSHAFKLATKRCEFPKALMETWTSNRCEFTPSPCH